MPTLFPDQDVFIGGVRASFAAGNKTTLGVAPCGFGKTFCFSKIAKGVTQNNKRVTILAHRGELLEQISAALRIWGVAHGMLMGGMIGMPRQPAVVASVGTLARRLKHFPAPDLIIVDEAHHCCVDSQYHKIIQAFPGARVLGVTATPCRLDGQGLGDIFQHMVEGPSIAELITLGRLTPADVYAPSIPDLGGVKRRGGDYVKSELEAVMDKPSITGHAVEHYRKLAYSKRGVAFCVSIKHAMDVAEDFRRAGFRAQHIEGKMDKAQRASIIGDFRKGKIQMLTSADLISEGFDVPDIEVAIGLRPTESLSLYIQQAGRAIRNSPGKTKALLIDHAGNTLRHGFIDQPRQWTLEGAEERKTKGESVPRVQTCPVCFAMQSPRPVCVKCMHVFQAKGRKIEHVDGELVQVSRAEDYQAPEAQGSEDLERLYHIIKNVQKNRGQSLFDAKRIAFSVVSGKLASRLAKERGLADGSVNGLMPEEIADLRARTIDRDNVKDAMRNEDAIAEDVMA